MPPRSAKSKGLGRGLSSFLADAPQATSDNTIGDGSGLRTVPIEFVLANPDQPRRRFDPEKLEELANSLREKGILQPLLVRPHPQKAEHFEIVAGERRWRAAQKAELHNVPVIVRELTDTEVFEIALIENVQRADLSPLEEAQGLSVLLEQFGYTQEKLSKAIGKSRPHIANMLRLLTLPDAVQLMLSRGELTAGHARALIPAKDPAKLAREIISKSLSVRQAEALVKSESASEKSKIKPKVTGKVASKDADTRALEADLSAHLGLKISIDHKGKQGGELRVSYKTLEELDGLCQLLSR